MVKTEMIRLMTWKRRHFRCFPYGSSILPVILTVAVFEIPSLALTYDLFLAPLTNPNLLPLALLLTQIFTITSLLLCVYTNPGIIPQQVDKYEWHQELTSIPAISPLKNEEHKFLIETGGLFIEQKYCVECHIYRPVRTIHCHVCNHCVQKYDHHCPWLGVCVGKFNYRYFVLFIASITFLSGFTATVSLIIIIRSALQGVNILSYLLQILVGTLSAAFFFPILKLLVYHMELIFNRQTTNENLKKIYMIIKNDVPFDRCAQTARPAWVENDAKLVLNTESSTESYRSQVNRDSLNKGKRYSMLVSERQSVLNYLVETEL